MEDLLKMKDAVQITNEEKVFVKNSIKAIEECLQRKSEVQVDWLIDIQAG